MADTIPERIRAFWIAHKPSGGGSSWTIVRLPLRTEHHPARGFQIAWLIATKRSSVAGCAFWAILRREGSTRDGINEHLHRHDPLDPNRRGRLRQGPVQPRA